MKVLFTLFLLTTISLISQDRLIWEIKGSPVYNSKAILSPTEKIMAITNSSAKPMTIWDVETGNLIDSMSDIMRISYDLSLTGDHFVYIDIDHVLHYRNIYTHSDDKTYNLPSDVQINSLKVLNNGKTPKIALLTYKDNKLEILVLDLEEQKIIQQYPLERNLYENYGNSLFVDTFGDYIAYTFSNGFLQDDIDTVKNRIVLIDTKNEKLITKTVAVNRINDIKINPEKNKIILATGSWQNDFENIVELDFDLNKTAEFEGSQRNFYKVDFVSKGSDEIYALTDDSLYTLNSDLNIINSKPFYSYQTMDFLDGNKYLQMLEYQVRIIDIDTKEITKVFEHYKGNMHRMGVTDIDVSKDDKYVFSSSFDGTIKKWDAVSGQFIENYIDSYNGIRKIEISEDNKYFTYTGFEEVNNITILNYEDKELISKFEIPTSITDFEISKDSKYLIIGTYGGEIYICDIDKKKIIDSLEGDYWVHGVGISSDNKYIASGNQDGIFKLWDFENKQELFSGKITDKNGLYSVVFSDYRDEILIGSGDGTMKIFGINDLEVLKQYYSNENSSSWSIFKDAIYSKDGNSIYGGMAQGTKVFSLGNSKGEILTPNNPNFNSFTIESLKYFNNETAFIAGDDKGNITKWNTGTISSVESELNRDDLVFPNPVVNTLHVNQSILNSINKYEITNLLGEVVRTGGNESEIDLSNLTSGTYIISLFSKSGQVRNKFVKQ